MISPGTYNTNQGPDFRDAKIRIDNTIWAGHVELHLQSSDWNRHGHDKDLNYKNVILHVVWQHDLDTIPLYVLELKNRVPKILLERYEELMNSGLFVPCEKNIREMDELNWQSWKTSMLATRLLRKAGTVQEILKQNNFHWEETLWWQLARNFGARVNTDAFESIARSIPLSLLSKLKNQFHQLEALLFGQAGLLNGDFKEDYPCLLQREYRFLQKKHGLKPIRIPIHFLRMRPRNFPTIRLAQLAMLVHQAEHLFNSIKEKNTTAEIKETLNVTANDYWHYHYKFDELSSYRPKKLGDAMINNIIINTIVPMLFAYGHYHQDEKYKQKAVAWLEETEAEKNSIIDGFGKLGIKCSNAFDTQALLELKTFYCDKKRCLDCAIGNAILKKA